MFGANIFKACEKGDMERVKKLVREGAKAELVNEQDKEGCTPLYKAAEQNKKDVVAYLLEAGADPNLCNVEGRTPIHRASMHGFEEVCRLLLNRGAKVDLPDKYGRTAEDVCVTTCLRLMMQEHMAERRRLEAENFVNVPDSSSSSDFASAPPLMMEDGFGSERPPAYADACGASSAPQLPSSAQGSGGGKSHKRGSGSAHSVDSVDAEQCPTCDGKEPRDRMVTPCEHVLCTACAKASSRNKSCKKCAAKVYDDVSFFAI